MRSPARAALGLTTAVGFAWFALPAVLPVAAVRPMVAALLLVGSVIALALAAQHTRGRERCGWGLVLVGPLGAMLPSIGSLAGLALGAGLLMVAGSDWGRDRYRVIDGLIAFGAVSSVACAFLLPGVLERLEGFRLAEGLLAGVQAVAAISCVVLVAYRTTPQQRPDLWLVGMGYAVGTLAGLPGLVAAGDHPSTWVPTAWWGIALPLAGVAIATGALVRRSRPRVLPAEAYALKVTPEGAAAVSDALIATSVALVAWHSAPIVSVALLVGVIGLRHLRSRFVERDNRRLAQDVRRRDDAVLAQYRASLAALAAALEARDGYTGLHGEETVALATAVARQMGLDPQLQAEVETAALLHDIGKLGTPDAILHKPAPLDHLEWRVMREHPVVGERILERVPGLERVALAVRHEHEHWDGTGYPDGLAGESIPLASRIVIVCDAFHAMTSDRPYRTSLPATEAVRELLRCSGTQFDPAVVAALLAVVSTEEPTGPRTGLLGASLRATLRGSALAPGPRRPDYADEPQPRAGAREVHPPGRAEQLHPREEADLPLLGRLFATGFALAGAAGVALAIVDPGPLLHASPDRWAILAAFAAAALCGAAPWRRLHRTWALAPTLGGVALLAGACATTGGSESPYALLYVFLAAGAASLTGPREAAVAVAAVVAATWLPLVYDDGVVVAEAAVAAFLLSTVAAVLAFTAQQSRRARRVLTDRAVALASEDPLTGLANRRAFEQRSAAALAGARRHGTPCALLFLDVDRFKTINDRFGHATGDEALSAVARAADQVCRAGDLLARVGGDEFALLLPGAGRAEAGHAARRLTEAVGAVRVAGTEPVRISVGIAVCPDDGPALHELLRAADRRMRESKAARHAVPVV